MTPARQHPLAIVLKAQVQALHNLLSRRRERDRKQAKLRREAAKLTTGALVALLAFTAPAWADERPRSFLRDEVRKLDLATPLLIHGGAQALDHFSTQAALRRGGVEVGPIAQHSGPNAARLIGTAAFLGADILAQKKGPKWSKWAVRAASVGVSVYAYKRNSKVGR